MKRHYGIDLLKMLAMMMVVAHHVLQGGGVEVALMKNGLQGWDVWFEQGFHCFCYCAVDCFVMATGFIMCQHEFKYIRIFRHWRQVSGYSLAMVALVWLFFTSVHIGSRTWLEALCPIIFNRYWFFTQYVALFFTIPYLNKLIGALNGKEKGMLLLSGFGLLSMAPLIAGRDLFYTHWGYSYIWFLYLYLLGGVIAQQQIMALISARWGWIFLALGCVGSAMGSIGSVKLPQLFGGGARVGDLAFSYTSPTLLLEAIGLLLIFSRISIMSDRTRKLIVFFAPSTFIVYIVHSNALFRQVTNWTDCFRVFADYGGIGASVGATVVAILVFWIIVVLDGARRLFWKQVSRCLKWR